MFILITLIHVVLCIALILIVLLQTGKGSDLASAFGGGGSQAMFGGRGPASFLNKMTTIVAILFMATSITLAYMSSGHSGSLMSGLEEPAEQTETVATPGETSQAADTKNGETQEQQSESAADVKDTTSQQSSESNNVNKPAENKAVSSGGENNAAAGARQPDNAGEKTE